MLLLGVSPDFIDDCFCIRRSYSNVMFLVLHATATGNGSVTPAAYRAPKVRLFPIVELATKRACPRCVLGVL